MPRAEIARKQAAFTLKQIYAELAGKLKAPRGDKSLIRTNLDHVGAVILMIEPGFDLTSIRPVTRYKRNPLFKRGECFRAALAVLGQANEPLTVQEVAIRVLKARGVAEPSTDQIKNMFGAVYASFKNHEGDMVFASNGRPARWELVSSRIESKPSLTAP